jgi:hypothetical protein
MRSEPETEILPVVGHRRRAVDEPSEIEAP